MTSSELSSSTETTASVGTSQDFPTGELKLAKVGEHRILVVRTPSGIHAIDNACPHQGYGLTTGSLSGELVTCLWHNWKFRVADGKCLIGEEDVRSHQVIEADGDVSVTVAHPSAKQQRDELWPSLDRGFDRNYSGQMSRDTARLLRAGATPIEIVARQLVRSQPREEWGVGHGLATATDCVNFLDLYGVDEQVLATVQALAALAEPTLRLPEVELPEPADTDVVEAIESEDVSAAVAGVLYQIDAGATAQELLATFVETVGRHHLSYGHGAIYVQKSFEMLEKVGWDHARRLLPYLTSSLIYGTREDTLPYMRQAAREIDAIDTAAMATAPIDVDWAGRDALVDTILNSEQVAVSAAADAVTDGAGVIGVIDAVSQAASVRLLGYDPALDFDMGVNFGWLDITHALTYANAARWVHDKVRGAASTRLALFALFLVHDSGRALRRGQYTPAPMAEPAPGDLVAAVAENRPDAAAAHALAGDPVEVGDALARLSLEDRSGAWIVMAHIIKMAQAARVEAAATGSSLPLAAAARFMAAPKLERFVSRNVAEASEFVRTGAPPLR